MTQSADRYFIQMGDNGLWNEVSKLDYVNAERMAGFHNTLGQPDEPATAGFSGGIVHGRLCYQGQGLPKNYVSLEGKRVSDLMTPQQFHADLAMKFNQHCEAVRKGREEPYSFMEEEGLDYNGWIEHRHGWAITEDYLCGVSLASTDDDEDSGLEVPFEECGTCMRLVELYRDYVSKYRVEQSRERRERRRELEEDEW